MTAKSPWLAEGIALWKGYGEDDVLKGVDLQERANASCCSATPARASLNLPELISSGSIVLPACAARRRPPCAAASAWRFMASSYSGTSTLRTTSRGARIKVLKE